MQSLIQTLFSSYTNFYLTLLQTLTLYIHLLCVYMHVGTEPMVQEKKRLARLRMLPLFHPNNIMQESFQHIKRMNSRPVVFYYPNTE